MVRRPLKKPSDFGDNPVQVTLGFRVKLGLLLGGAPAFLRIDLLPGVCLTVLIV